MPQLPKLMELVAQFIFDFSNCRQSPVCTSQDSLVPPQPGQHLLLHSCWPAQVMFCYLPQLYQVYIKYSAAPSGEQIPHWTVDSTSTLPTGPMDSPVWMAWVLKCYLPVCGTPTVLTVLPQGYTFLFSCKPGPCVPSLEGNWAERDKKGELIWSHLRWQVVLNPAQPS